MRRGSALTIGIGLALLLSAGSAPAFEFNGRRWTDMPIPYYINPSGCPVLDDGVDIVEIVRRATANWSDPACSAVRFEFQGSTDASWAPDGQNTIYCVAADWNMGEGAAGAALWLPTGEGEPYEVDLALNVDEYNWALGGGSAMQNIVLDPVAVVSHELGHWLGMSHSVEPFATMYYASLPNGLGATLAGDDIAGICTLYPSGEDMCRVDADCPSCHVCASISEVPVCEEILDPPGAFCSKNHIYCEGMCWVSFQECSQACLFTNMAYSEGYCAPLCDEAAPDCPEGFTCQHVSTADVWVCQSEAAPLDNGVDRAACEAVDPPDGGDGGDGAVDGADGGGPDAADGTGDAGLDGADGAPDGADAGPGDGEAAPAGGGCGCAQGAAGPPLGPGLLLLVLLGVRRRLCAGC